MLFYFFVILFFYCGCSPNVKYQAKPVVIDKKTVQFNEDEKTLYGTGRVLFNQPLFDLHSKELYFLKAELFNENSSLILHSHFTGFNTQDGIKVFFLRKENQLIINVSTPSYPKQDLHIVKDYFTKNQKLEIYVEVQNGTENFVNVKVWDTYINPSGYLRKSTPFLSRQNLIANSEVLLFYSRGQGLLWGAELNKVRLIKIFRESVNQW